MKHIEPYKYFYMLMMFLWVASVSPLTSFNISQNPILMPVYLAVLLFYFVKYCKLTVKPLFIMSGLFFVWFLLLQIKYDGIQEFKFQPIYNMIIAHIAFNLYRKDEFLYLYERILVKLCVLSLIVWIGVNLFPSVVVNLMHSVSVINPQPPTETYSFIVGLGSQVDDVLGLRRNIGFTWEPGRYSCYLILGMYLNLISHNFQIFPIKKNINLYILLLGLLSTLSTTGYFALIAIVLLYLYNNSLKTKTITIICLIPLIQIALSLPFMLDKLNIVGDIDNDINGIYYYSKQGYDHVAPQRIASFYFNIQNIIHDFWLGCNEAKFSYVTNNIFNGIIVTPCGGIIGIIDKYGIFVSSFFYYWLIKSSIYLSKEYKYNGKLIFALLFVLISFSYDWWEHCFMMYLYLSAFYVKYSKRYF